MFEVLLKCGIQIHCLLLGYYESKYKTVAQCIAAVRWGWQHSLLACVTQAIRACIHASCVWRSPWTGMPVQSASRWYDELIHCVASTTRFRCRRGNAGWCWRRHDNTPASWCRWHGNAWSYCCCRGNALPRRLGRGNAQSSCCRRLTTAERETVSDAAVRCRSRRPQHHKHSAVVSLKTVLWHVWRSTSSRSAELLSTKPIALQVEIQLYDLDSTPKLSEVVKKIYWQGEHGAM